MEFAGREIEDADLSVGEGEGGEEGAGGRDGEGGGKGFGLFEFEEVGGGFVVEDVGGLFVGAGGLPVFDQAVGVGGDDAVVSVVVGHEDDGAVVDVRYCFDWFL